MAEVVKNTLGNLKVEHLEPVVCKGDPRPSDFEALDRLADTVAGKHAEMGLKPARLK